MEKRADIQIYMLVAEPKGKDDPELIDNSLYTPIQCGANDSKYDICELKDNKDQDNISNMNWLFFENTGSYYIAKHINNKKYIGQCSYRRRLLFNEDFEFDSIFFNYDIILPKPYKWGKDMYNMYKSIHNIIDFENCLNIVNELYPEYSNEVNLAKNNNLMLYYSSGFIMSSEDYKKYFNWLFSIFNELIKNLFHEVEIYKGYSEYDKKYLIRVIAKREYKKYDYGFSIHENWLDDNSINEIINFLLMQ